MASEIKRLEFLEGINVSTPLDANLTDDVANNQSGSNVNLTAVDNGIIRLTNASLVSIGGYASTSNGRITLLLNATGRIVTIKNEDISVTAANRIVTGDNTDVLLYDKQTMALVYNQTTARHQVISTKLLNDRLYCQNKVLHAIGDSITKGTAVTNPFPKLIANAIGYTHTNWGIDGAYAADIANNVYRQVITTDSRSILAIGINNMRTSAGSAAKAKIFAEGHAAYIAYLGITNKIAASDITFSGSWSNNQTYPNAPFVSKYSSTNGNYIEFSAYGPIVYLGMMASDVSTGTFTVAVDGTTYGTYSVAGSGNINTALSTVTSPMLIRVNTKTSNLHTIRITITSSGQNVFFDWAGVPNNLGPRVFVGGITRMTSGGYGTYGGSDSLAVDYDRIVKNNVQTLADDGIKVNYVNSAGVMKVSTDLDVDGLHPTQAGYQKIADNFLIEMEEASLTKNISLPQEIFFPTLQNSWDNTFANSNGYERVHYRKDRNERVFLGGMGSNGTIGGSAAMFTLPIGYRPLKNHRFPIIAAGLIGYADVLSTGVVAIQNGTANTYVTLGNISFIAEQ